MKFSWSRQSPRPPMTDDEFEEWIEIHAIRGWRVESRTMNTASIVRDLLPDRWRAGLELFSGHYTQAQLTMLQRPQERKTLTRFDKRNTWVSPQERQLLGRGADE